MTKNLMPEIAKMLGVELGEEFKIKGYDPTCWFDLDGLHFDGWVAEDEEDAMLHNLLCGEAEIIKLPWKPKKGDVYFTFGLLGDKWVVRSLWWGGFPEEYALLSKGWMYRTEKEVQAALPTVAKELGVEYKL
ncbi:MAG: hypothetical protein [Bacteriophage sp.]|jgi:hypothetical protein|nr:MAG: hypothetical protein [Bacteriophage sp.]